MRRIQSLGGRRARATQDKRDRIYEAARALFAELGVSGVTTQQVADRADVAIGTLFRYAATKAELLIMVQNERFAEAIQDGLAAASRDGHRGPVDDVLTLVTPVVACVREHVENGRAYLHELVVGDPSEPYRRAGLALSAQLESGIASTLAHDGSVPAEDAATLARVVSAVLHLTLTAALFSEVPVDAVLADLRTQVHAILGTRALGA